MFYIWRDGKRWAAEVIGNGFMQVCEGERRTLNMKWFEVLWYAHEGRLLFKSKTLTFEYTIEDLEGAADFLSSEWVTTVGCGTNANGNGNFYEADINR